MSNSKNVPPGWTVNASAWKQRLSIVGLALIGFGIALYLPLAYHVLLTFLSKKKDLLIKNMAAAGLFCLDDRTECKDSFFISLAPEIRTV